MRTAPPLETGRPDRATQVADAQPRARSRRLGVERGLLALIGLYLLTLPLVAHDIRAADEIEYFAYVRSLAFDRDLDFTNEYRHFVDRSPSKYACGPADADGCEELCKGSKKPCILGL